MTLILKKTEISKLLDIKKPLLMIDEISIEGKNQKAKGFQLINKEEWFFKCHLPLKPVMPAVLIIEGMLQTLALLIYKSIDHKFEKAYIVDIRSKIFSSITNNDSEIIYIAKLISFKRGISKGEVEVFVNKEKKAKGEFIYASPNLMGLPNKLKSNFKKIS